MSLFESLPWQKSSPALDAEQVLDVFDTHWIKYIWPVCIFIVSTCIALAILATAGFAILAGPIVQKIIFVVGFILLCFAIHWFFHTVMSASMEDVIITNHRFIYVESSLWSLDVVHEISLQQVKAVDSKKSGITQNILRYGTISFDTGGSDMSRRVFVRIPHPDRKAKIITDLLRAVPLP